MNILDLFAGAGGFSKGFHDAGFQNHVMIDFDSKAVETLNANFGNGSNIILKEDLSKLTPYQLDKILGKKEFDLIIGGPPCQGWSLIGRGKLRSLGLSMTNLFDDPRNRLYKRFIKFVNYYRPKVFVMENVTGLLRYNGINTGDIIVKYFSSIGYETSYKILNAKNFGIPQNRERVIIVGVRKDLNLQFNIPEKTSSKIVSLKEAISDLPRIQDGSKVWERNNYNHSKNVFKYALEMRKGIKNKIVTDHVCKKHRPQDIEAFKFLKQGQLYRDLPKHLKRYRDDIFEDKYRKLKYHDISGCITAHLSKDQYSHLHPTQSRAISVREAARIQSFPDSYVFYGGMADKFKQIGNAVPPKLSRALAIQIKKQIFDRI